MKRMVAELIPIIDISDEGYFELKENEGFLKSFKLMEKTFSLGMSPRKHLIYECSRSFTRLIITVSSLPL